MAGEAQAPEGDLGSSSIVLSAHERAETIMNTAAIVTSAVPAIGGPISNILSGISSNRRFERVRLSVLELADRLRDLTDAQEEYVRSEDFEDLLAEALQRVTQERSSEKRTLYATFLSNSVRDLTVDYDEKLGFLRVLEALQPRDIRVLQGYLEMGKEKEGLFTGPPRNVLDKHLLGLRHEPITLSLKLLEREGILEGVSDIGAIKTARSAASTLRGYLTPFGRVFIRFVLEDSETDVAGGDKG
jgi:hypothetical protein